LLYFFSGFGAANACKYLIGTSCFTHALVMPYSCFTHALLMRVPRSVVCARQSPPNNDNKVLEHALNALIALLWNSPKNRLRMANKEVIDLQVASKAAVKQQ
jgi:hypothetical protein